MSKLLKRSVCLFQKSVETIILLYGNAHTLYTTPKALVELKFEPIPHPPWKPDLAPCNLFPQLKQDITGIYFTTYDKLKDTVKSWIEERSPAFFIDRIRKWIQRWKKLVPVNYDWKNNYKFLWLMKCIFIPYLFHLTIPFYLQVMTVH